MPAEWEPHAATWLSWPHNENSWPGRFEIVEPVYAQMVRAIAESEPVRINVADAAMERRAQRFLQAAGASGEITFHHVPTNDAWCRDHGAIFVVANCEQGTANREREALPFAVPDSPFAATKWRYNAWGNKYPHDLDDRVAAQMASLLDVPLFERGIVLEGGSIDVNGAGVLLTTEACLLNPNRNPDLSREQIENELRAGLGVEEVVWLGDGIAGDDTDGHIDDLTRFVAERTVVTVVESNPHDENYAPLRENLSRLRSIPIGGKPLDVVELPMPPALVYDGQRVPASYANFYIANTSVLLPGYDRATDARAQAILAEHFPTREVVVIDCSDLIWGLGAFHCLTQQVPAI
ncbi:MAG: agmatine deiminase family protein [Planctomycetaceae bacterium]|nr:agmatine deiminase family protein [Planctomycetaceae bacterium]